MGSEMCIRDRKVTQKFLSNFKIKELTQKYINLRQFDHHSASFCVLDPKKAVPRPISKRCILVFPRKSASRVGDFRGNTKMHLFEIDLGIVFFGSSAQNDAEWWSYCRKLIYFCASSLILKLERNFMPIAARLCRGIITAWSP